MLNLAKLSKKIIYMYKNIRIHINTYTHTHTHTHTHTGPAVRVFANGPGNLGSIPGRVIPKTLKMELDTTLLNTQHYKVRFKGKVEQSREWSSAPHPTPWCSSYRKGEPSGHPRLWSLNFYLYIHTHTHTYIYIVTSNSLKCQNGILFSHVWRRGRLALDPS